jgi:predicted RNA methylase
MLATAEKLYAAVRRFDYLNAGYEKLCAALDAFAKTLPGPEHNLNAAVLGRLMNRVKIGYYPTDLSHAAHIKRAVAFPETQVNILDPCCGCGLALSALAEGKNAVTYGAEIDEYRAVESQTRLGRVAAGSFFHSRVSREAFHAVFLNPPYLSMLTEGGGTARMEKTFLAAATPHLMAEGVLVYIIPYYRVSADVCQFLCDHFEDITAWRFEGKEFERFRQAVIIGRRKKQREAESAGAQDLLRRFLSPENLTPLSRIPNERYALPAKAAAVQCFKGERFNVRELAEQLARSSSLNMLFDASRLEQLEKHPPLPLNASQIGLVGGSGLMNGLVDCETPHIVKGRVVRRHKSEITAQETTDGKTISEVREVTSNHMIFNILAPAGFKSLT